MKSILILPMQITVYASHGNSLLETLICNKIELDHSCGGMGSCGTCRIIIDKASGALPAANVVEQEMIADRGFQENERLACQLVPNCDLTIRIPNK